MSQSTFKPKAYLLNSCPFCFKYLLFMGEAKLVDQIEVIGIDPQSPQFEETKAKLAQATQAKVSFPIVEVEPGVYQTDSDQLIDHFAKKHHVEAGSLPVLAFYKQGLFPAYINLYKENMALKQKTGG
jgi:cell division septation protein DedD